MRAAVYTRQSRDHTGEGAAISRQRDDCLKLADLRGWEVVAEFPENDTSASSGKTRPQWELMLTAARAGEFDVIVAWHVDRLTRTMRDLEVLLELGKTNSVTVATVNGDLDLTNDSGRLVGRILAAVASGEVERKGARQKASNRQAAEAGKPPQRGAFGYASDGLALVATEAQAVRDLFDMVLAGTSLVEATAWLNSQGFRTTRGGEWKRSNIRWMLLNPRYAGRRMHNGKDVGPGQWPAIVTDETFQAMRSLLSDPRRKKNHGTARRWLGSGIYLCGVCGSDVRVNYRSAKEGRIYRCRRAAHLSRLADPIDEYVEKQVRSVLSDPQVIKYLRSKGAPEVKALRAQTETKRQRLKALPADYARGLLTGEQVKEATEILEEELSALEAKQARLGQQTALSKVLDKPDPVAAYDGSGVSIRREILGALMGVILTKGKPGRFDDATVIIADIRDPEGTV